MPPALDRTTPRGHLDFLDGIRAVAALFVLAHHSWFELYPDAMNHRPTGRFAHLVEPLAFGHWAVVVFIVLSGFCLALPVAATPDGTIPGGTRAFLARRARRILPPYFAALLFSLALTYTLVGTRNGTHWDVALSATHRGVDAKGLLWAVLLLGDKAESWQVNHAFWSVQVEAKIYLLFPLLVWAGRRLGAWPAAAVTVAVAFAVARVGHRWELVGGPKVDGLMIHFVGLFAMGMLAAHTAGRPARLPAWLPPAVAAAAMAGTSGLAGTWGIVRSVNAVRTLDAGVGLAFAAGLVVLARQPNGVVGRLLARRPLVRLGGISYSFYLLHAPLVQVAYRYVVDPLRLPVPAQLALLIVVSTALTIAAAVPFFALCERPFKSRRLPPTQLPSNRLAPSGILEPP